MKKALLTLVLALSSMFLAQAADPPNVDNLLKQIRRSATSQGERDVQGKIRKGKIQVPFGMSVRSDAIVFQYKNDNEWIRFDLRFKDNGQDILVVKDGKPSKMPPSNYIQPIGQTDVTYDDLTMRFLYWPKGQMLPEDASSVIKGRSCWVVQIPNPNINIGQYAWVRVWIDKENGATWQIDGYDAKGDLMKRFMISAVQKLKDGSWFFKQMKLEKRDPNNPKRTIAVNYIEMGDLPDK